MRETCFLLSENFFTENSKIMLELFQILNMLGFNAKEQFFMKIMVKA